MSDIEISNTVAYLDLNIDESTQYFDIFFNSDEEFIEISLSEEISLDLDLFISSQDIDIFMDDGSNVLDVEMLGGGEGRFPYYAGNYEVDPRKVEQILETRNRSMSGDVIVHPIFYSEVPNTYGDTCYIGME